MARLKKQKEIIWRSSGSNRFFLIKLLRIERLVYMKWFRNYFRLGNCSLFFFDCSWFFFHVFDENDSCIFVFAEYISSSRNFKLESTSGFRDSVIFVSDQIDKLLSSLCNGRITSNEIREFLFLTSYFPMKYFYLIL